jgi:hypothetical protein
MLQLFQNGGGSTEIILGEPLRNELSTAYLRHAEQLLHTQGAGDAVSALSSLPFQLCEGTNGFGDQFKVLHARVDAAQYVRLLEVRHDAAARSPYSNVAWALEQVDCRIRFIAATLDEHTTTVAVPNLRPASASEVLEQALAEVERALAAGTPAVAVDRIHTATHAYLRGLAASAGITSTADADITSLFGLLRREHPSLQAQGAQPEAITKVLRSLANIVDALNPLRNHASLAHPPQSSLLADAEAMLVVHAARTLLHYIERRLDPPTA